MRRGRRRAVRRVRASCRGAARRVSRRRRGEPGAHRAGPGRPVQVPGSRPHDRGAGRRRSHRSGPRRPRSIQGGAALGGGSPLDRAGHRAGRRRPGGREPDARGRRPRHRTARRHHALVASGQRPGDGGRGLPPRGSRHAQAQGPAERDRGAAGRSDRRWHAYGARQRQPAAQGPRDRSPLRRRRRQGGERLPSGLRDPGPAPPLRCRR